MSDNKNTMPTEALNKISEAATKAAKAAKSAAVALSVFSEIKWREEQKTFENHMKEKILEANKKKNPYDIFANYPTHKQTLSVQEIERAARMTQPLPKPIFRKIELGSPLIDGNYIHRKIAANCVDMTDEIILRAIIEMAKDEGIQELYLLDKEFVLNALKKALAERSKTND